MIFRKIPLIPEGFFISIADAIWYIGKYLELLYEL